MTLVSYCECKQTILILYLLQQNVAFSVELIWVSGSLDDKDIESFNGSTGLHLQVRKSGQGKT